MFGFSGGSRPSFWNNVFDLTIGHRRQPCQNVMQIGVGFNAMTSAALDDRVKDCAAFTRIGIPEEQPILLFMESFP
jgi:hypothetical protein